MGDINARDRSKAMNEHTEITNGLINLTRLVCEGYYIHRIVYGHTPSNSSPTYCVVIMQRNCNLETRAILMAVPSTVNKQALEDRLWELQVATISVINVIESARDKNQDTE